MSKLMAPGNIDHVVKEAFKEGDFIPTIVVVLSVAGEDRMVLLVKTAKAKRGEVPSWMPPQRQMKRRETVENAAFRVLAAETGITPKSGVVYISALGYINRVLQKNRPRPEGYPDARGRMMICVNMQIAKVPEGVCPCDPSIAECKFVDRAEFDELIKTASNGKQVIAQEAVARAYAFDRIAPTHAALAAT